MDVLRNHPEYDWVYDGRAPTLDKAACRYDPRVSEQERPVRIGLVQKQSDIKGIPDKFAVRYQNRNGSDVLAYRRDCREGRRYSLKFQALVHQSHFGLPTMGREAKSLVFAAQVVKLE